MDFKTKKYRNNSSKPLAHHSLQPSLSLPKIGKCLKRCFVNEKKEKKTPMHLKRVKCTSPSLLYLLKCLKSACQNVPP